MSKCNEYSPTDKYVTIDDVLKRKRDVFEKRQLRYKYFAINEIDNNLLSLTDDEDNADILKIAASEFESFKEFKLLMKLTVKEAKARGFKVKLLSTTNENKETYYIVNISGW